MDEQAGVAEARGEAAPEVSLAEPLLRHYLLAVASLGTYLAFRAYVIARRLDADARASRARALTWACAVAFAPAACAYLYEAPRLARIEIAARGGRPSRRPLLLAPLLYLALGLALLASPVSALWAPLLLLLPIPFVLVQAEVNALAAASLPADGPPAAHGLRRWPAIVALALLPVTALVFWHLDRQATTSVKTSRRLTPGAIVSDTNGQFSLRIPARGWTQLGPGSVGDGSEELGLQSVGGQVWAVVYTQPIANSSLDDVVSYRRSLMQQERASLMKVEERRFFLEGADLVPASFARYRLRHGRAFGSYVVLTTTVGDEYVEVVGYGGDDSLDQLEKLVRSFRQGVQRS